MSRSSAWRKRVRARGFCPGCYAVLWKSYTRMFCRQCRIKQSAAAGERYHRRVLEAWRRRRAA